MKIKRNRSSKGSGRGVSQRRTGCELVELPDRAAVFDQLGHDFEQASSLGQPYLETCRGILPWLFLLSVLEKQPQS